MYPEAEQHTTATGFSARLLIAADDIKLAHSVFALPFALLAMFMAAAHDNRLPAISEAVLIVLCMFFARTVAMSFNRWADASLDAQNPRTASRAIPSGRLSKQYMLGLTIMCSFAFIISCAGFWLINGNYWPVLLCPAVLVYLVFYSFTKRFTSLCHLFLGIALAISPLATVLAVQPDYLRALPPYLLAALVICWVTGFDIIYALQDIDADKQVGLFSMPVHIGMQPALWISRTAHLLVIVILLALKQCGSYFHIAFTLAAVAAAMLLVIQHILICKSHAKHIHTAFFTTNSIISILISLGGILDLVLALT